MVRELTMGVGRFDAIARNVGAGRDVLTARLRRLEQLDIVEKVPVPSSRRSEYALTPLGQQLGPVLVALRQWGDRLAEPDAVPPTPFVHECGHPVNVDVVCRACGEVAAPGSVVVTDVDDEPNARRVGPAGRRPVPLSRDAVASADDTG